MNDTIEPSRCSTTAVPVVTPRPVTTLITPAEMPAREAASANISEVRGVSSDGLSTTTVLPAATDPFARGGA